jgi:hypothetical protein
MEKIITYFGQNAKVGCDEKCHKAWGINNRPKVQLSDDEDDFVYLSDDELEIAPVDPGTYEGGHAKPTLKSEMLNKWCIRECERCSMTEINKSHLPLKLIDFSKRISNTKI